MQLILTGILSLIQYKIEYNQNNFQLTRCLCCGKSNPWRHGTYSRESDRINPSNESLNSILIQRYYCPTAVKHALYCLNVFLHDVGIYGKHNKLQF